MTKYERNDTFPLLEAGMGKELAVKAKGINRNFAKFLEISHFKKLIKDKQPASKIDIAYLKRHRLKVYLVTNRKYCLSDFNTKRAIVDDMITKRSHLSCPLFFKRLRIIT